MELLGWQPGELPALICGSKGDFFLYKEVSTVPVLGHLPGALETLLLLSVPPSTAEPLP